MAYRVSLTNRAIRDSEQIYKYIHAASSPQAFSWFRRLAKAVFSLEQNPERGAVTPERKEFRQLLYGRKPHVYRIIYAIDESTNTVDVLHIRHGARDAFTKI